MTRRLVIAASVVVALLIAAPVLFRALYEPAADDGAKPASVPALTDATVAAVSGTVERLKDGAWIGVAVGDTLHTEDTVRTGPGARIEVAVDAASRLTVGEGASVRIAELTEVAHTFKVTSGRVNVDYAENGARVLRVEDDSGRTVATRGARFTIAADADRFAVATERGSVDLASAGTTVSVGAGTQSFAEKGKAPAAPTPIPVELLLRVAKAGGDGKLCEIRGSVDATSRLSADGKAVTIGADGSYRVSLAAADKTPVKLVVIDTLGRKKEAIARCTLEEEKLRDFKVRWQE